METLNAIRLRMSVREYSDKPLRKDIIEKIIDCARLAPTARKIEPWEFIVITDRKMLVALADITDHGRFISSCACAIAVFCKETKYYLEDGCAATENILIAATDMGVGSCWVAGDKKQYCQKLADTLEVPAGYKLVSIIALGYAAKKAIPAHKRPISSVIHWEKY